MSSSRASPSLTELPEPICGGCRLEIDEASANQGAIAFSGSLWHLDCFRCAKCNNRVTTGQDDLLLLSDGHPICSSCNYTCQFCRLPILEEAILTGDEAYHASCFTCRVCSKRIEELVFAKTSQGIYCMECHNQRVERSRRHAEAKKQRAAARAAAAAAAAEAAEAAQTASLSRPSSPPAPSSPVRSPTHKTRITSSSSIPTTSATTPSSNMGLTKSDSTPLTRSRSGDPVLSPSHSTTRTSPSSSASSHIPAVNLVPAASSEKSSGSISPSAPLLQSRSSSSSAVYTKSSSISSDSPPSSSMNTATLSLRPSTANSYGGTTTTLRSSPSSQRTSAATTTSTAMLSVFSSGNRATGSSSSTRGGGGAGDRSSKRYSFYDPDFVDLMTSLDKVGTEEGELSLSLDPKQQQQQKASSPRSQQQQRSSRSRDPTDDEDDDVGRRAETDGDGDPDRRRTLKPGSLRGAEALFAGMGGYNDSSLSVLGPSYGGAAGSASSMMGMLPSASTSMDSFSLLDGYESTDSLVYAPPQQQRSSSAHHLRADTAEPYLASGGELTDSERGAAGGGGGQQQRSSRSSSVLYLAAVSEAEQRMKEEQARLLRGAGEAEEDVYGSEAESVNGGTGSGRGGNSKGLTRDGTLRASSSGLASSSSASRRAAAGGGGRSGGDAAAPAASSSSPTITDPRHNARGTRAAAMGSGGGGYDAAPLRALSLKVKQKMKASGASVSPSSATASAGGGGGAGGRGPSATAAGLGRLIKDAKGNMVPVEAEFLEKVWASLDQVSDQIESMQGQYDGMKRASRLAVRGYNAKSQNLEKEVEKEVSLRYKIEVEVASLKRKLAEQASQLSAVAGEAKRSEAWLRRSQDVRSMVTDMERSLAQLTVERDVRMAELAQLNAAGAAAAAIANEAGGGDKSVGAGAAAGAAPPTSPSTLSPSLASSTSIGGGSNPLLSPLLSAVAASPTGTGSPKQSSGSSAARTLPPIGLSTSSSLPTLGSNDQFVVANLSTRLDAVKDKYKREIDELALERDALLTEVDELRQSRDVFIDEAGALNARNEELSAQLALLQKRIQFAQKQEAALSTAAKLRDKQLPVPAAGGGGGAGPGGASSGAGTRGGFGFSSKHRPQQGSVSSASELQLFHQQQQQQHQQAAAQAAEIARPVRVQKAEATPVVKKFKWMKTSKVAGQGIAAALPLPGTGAANMLTSNGHGSGLGGSTDGSAAGAGVGTSSGANGSHGGLAGSPGLGPNMGAAGHHLHLLNGAAGGGNNNNNNASSGLNGSGDSNMPDGLVVREHLFQPFNILRPIRCFACQKNMWGQTEVRCALCGQSCHSKCLQNLPTSCLQPYSGGQDQPEPTGPAMFGRDLVEQAGAEGRDVPLIVEKCVAAVEASGMDYEGIYRKSGGTSQLRVITQLFERGQPFDLQDMDRFNDVSAITSVLKNYFRELPVPLLTFELHEQFVAVAEMRGEYEAKMERMAELIAQLPNVHFWTLRHLVVHLHRVQSRADENRMNSRNLGVVFGPTLMRSGDPSQEFAHMGGKAMTIEFFIDNPSLFAV
ncbi:hypothetical protein V8E36_002181 [Tilletia maclaganii]